MTNAKGGCGALCFAVVDARTGKDAANVAFAAASWIASRGQAVLLADLSEAGTTKAGRPLSEIAGHLGCMEPAAIRGLLSVGRPPQLLGALSCDAAPGDVPLRQLLRAYNLVIFASSGYAKLSLQSVPALIVIAPLTPDGLSSSGRLIDTMLSGSASLRPVAFATEGGDPAIGARLSSGWRLPFWGAAEDAGDIAERILERATPASISSSEAAHASCVARKVAAPVEDGAPHATRTDEDGAADELLSLLRAERQFKELKPSAGDAKDEGSLRTALAVAARRLLGSIEPRIIAGVDPDALVARVVDEAAGLGPLERMLADPTVTEIMVNGADRIYLEREGVIQHSAQRFSSSKHLMAVIERMVARAGRRIDESSPMVDARLPDGSRLNVVIPPLAIDGPAVTIRRFSKRMRGIDDAIESGMLSVGAARFLSACVSARVSIVVSGGTGAGKTTLLGILAGAINARERIVTIEDAAELNLDATHVVRLEARPAGIEGTGAVSIRDLLRNALRMRPDRIIVGEARGPEALDMLQAMNTGHEGSLATVHANSPRDAISRLETMVLMAGAELPLLVVREQIVRAVGLIVQVARTPGGARRVVEIAEVVGMEGATPCMQTLAFDSGEGRLVSTGIAPRLSEKMLARGVEIPPP